MISRSVALCKEVQSCSVPTSVGDWGGMAGSQGDAEVSGYL